MTNTRYLPSAALATAADVSAVAGLIARAFYDLPAVQWLVPQPELRLDVTRGYFAILVSHALQQGHVDVLDDGSGAAVWFHRADHLTDPPDYEHRRRAACGQHTAAFEILDAVFERHHPTAPHDYLAYIAVDPRLHGTGRGGLLLDCHHRRLDEAGVPAYLEASTESNIALYAKFGYNIGEPFYLPQGPPFWPMTRAARVPAPAW